MVGVALVGTGAAEGVVGTLRVGAPMVEAEGVGPAMAPPLQTPTRPSQPKPPMIHMQLGVMMAAEGRAQAWGDPPSPRKPGRVTGPALAETPTMLGGELLTERLVSEDRFRGSKGLSAPVLERICLWQEGSLMHVECSPC